MKEKLIERLNRVPGIAWLALIIFLLPLLSDYLVQFGSGWQWTDEVVGLLLIAGRVAVFVRDYSAGTMTQIIERHTNPPVPPMGQDFYPVAPTSITLTGDKVEPERSPINRLIFGP
jgi:hypothetical protein